MALSQEVVWTALPGGRSEDGRPRISALVSPRLLTDEDPPQLAGFPDFLNWPDVINTATFDVVVDGQGGPQQAERVSAPAEPQLWSSLFQPTTMVRSFAFRDFSTRNIRSFPVTRVLSYVTSLYQEIARTSPADLPPVAPGAAGTLDGVLRDLGGALGHFRSPHGRRARRSLEGPDIDRLLGTSAWRNGKNTIEDAEAYALLRRHHALDSAFAAGQVVPDDADPSAFGFASQAAMDFYQAHRFYDRPELIQPPLASPDPGQVPPAPSVPELDFHQMVSVLGDYPVLLRRLGLVVDLVLDLSGPPVGVLRLRPHVNQLSAFAKSWTPGTRYELSESSFFAYAKSGGDLGAGMLMLRGANDRFEDMAGPVRFHLVQVDADGAALKLLNMATQLWSVHNPGAVTGSSFDTPDTTGLPALRSAGVAVVRTERATSLFDRLMDEKSRNAVQDVNLVVHEAEHLTRGYRLDVRDEDGVWRSLCWRKGTYRIVPDSGPVVDVSPPGEPILDEGYVKSASATSADDQGSDLYVHETLLRWDGWSVVAKKPGRTIVPVESDDRTQQDETVARPEPTLATGFKLATDFVPVEHSLPRLRFGREYVFRARAVDLAGNSLTPDTAPTSGVVSDPMVYSRFEPVTPPVLVARAELTEGESLERMVIRSNFDTTAADHAAHHGSGQATNDRHVLPPKTSQLQAETHGCFDAAFGPSGDPGPQFAKAEREAGSVADAPGSTKIEGKLPPDAPAGAEPTGAYWTNSSPLIQKPPYLPDPMARGIALRGLPGGAGVDRREFTGDWPDYRPLVLRIAEKRGEVKAGDCHVTFDEPGADLDWDARGRVLTVLLGKGDVVVVRYSSYLPDGGLDVMAVWRRWLVGVADPELTQLARTGGHWMISPFRELVLVHAVRQPLCRPSVRLRSDRELGDTFAQVHGRTFLSVKSTGQVDLHASWKEPVDSLSTLEPRELDSRAQVASLRVDARLPEPKPWAQTQPEPDGTYPIPGEGGLPFGFPDLDTLPPGAADDPKQLAEWTQKVKHEFGDTKHRWVEYFLTGTTRFREYFPTSVTEVAGNITRSGAGVLCNILSSARPDAPRVEYLVPSFQWTEARATPPVIAKRTRVGGGLRVWLRRPWYSSGEGEKLAVVCWPGDLAPDAYFSKLVSGFGTDPAWTSDIPLTPLRHQHFANAVDHDDTVTLAEAEGTAQELEHRTVEIAAFEPEYDKTRQLWFCDIDLSPKAAPSYMPFVRLALARYQRHSVGNARLSRVIQTDFAQLLPSRTLTVTSQSPDTLAITINGPMATAPIHNRVEVTLEEHTGDIPGDLGWTEVRTSGDLKVVLVPGNQLWSGVLPLPVPRTRNPLRLLVKEFEHYAADQDIGQEAPNIPGHHLDRVVYADIVPLP